MSINIMLPAEWRPRPPVHYQIMAVPVYRAKGSCLLYSFEDQEIYHDRSSNEMQWSDLKIGHRGGSPGKRYVNKGDVSFLIMVQKWSSIMHMWTYSVCVMTWPNGNIFRVTGPLCGEFTGPGEFPTQRPVTRSFDVFFWSASE